MVLFREILESGCTVAVEPEPRGSDTEVVSLARERYRRSLEGFDEYWRDVVPSMLTESLHGEALVSHLRNQFEEWARELAVALAELRTGDVKEGYSARARIQLLQEKIEFLSTVARKFDMNSAYRRSDKVRQ